MNIHKSNLVVASIVAIVISLFSGIFDGFVQAAPPPQFTSAYVRLDRMKTGQLTGGTVCAKPTTTATEHDVEVTFPAGFGLDGTLAHWTTTFTNLPTDYAALPTPVVATAWPGITTASNITGQTVRFASSDLTVGTLYCFNFAATVTNPASGDSQTGVIHTLDAGAAIIDETNYALSIIANDTITVTGIVPPTFIFTISSSADAFTGNLSPAIIRGTTGRDVQVYTNAKGGWIGWIKDSQQGLYSASAAYTIPTTGTVNATPDTLSVATEGYVLDTNIKTPAAGGCDLHIDPEYDGVAANSGGTLSANFQPFIRCDGAPPATSNGDIVTLKEYASISAGTPAGSDYSDIITVVAAGNF